MSGSKQTTTTNSQTKPWDYTDAGVKQVVDNTNTLASDTSLFTPTYSDTTKAGVNQLGALGQQQSYTEKYGTTVGQQASDSFGTGNNQLASTAAGNYVDMDSNPYVTKYLDASANKATEAVNRSVSGAGRYGSGYHNKAVADSVGDIYSQGYASAYEKERQNQLQASSQLQQGGFNSVNVGTSVDKAQDSKANQTIQAGTYQDAMNDASKQGAKNATEWQSKMLSPYAQTYGSNTSTSETSKPANTMGMVTGGLMTAAGVATGNPALALSGFGSLANSASGGSATGYQGGSTGSGSNTNTNANTNGNTQTQGYGNGSGWQTSVYPNNGYGSGYGSGWGTMSVWN